MSDRKPLSVTHVSAESLDALISQITDANRHREIGLPPTSQMTSPLRKKRKSGIPTGNAGEYFVMGELLRREFDAQLADRNTKGYDLLVGAPDSVDLRKIQIKTVRSAPWYVRLEDFKGEFLDRITIYVLLGPPTGKAPVRYFIAKNADVAKSVHQPKTFRENGFMPLKAVIEHENRWDIL